jgi:hypothetical protein
MTTDHQCQHHNNASASTQVDGQHQRQQTTDNTDTKNNRQCQHQGQQTTDNANTNTNPNNDTTPTPKQGP